MNQSAFAAAGLYAALNVFILFWFVTATSILRKKHKIWVGDGGVAHLTRVMRGHANAVENMPMMIALLIIAAALGMPILLIHLVGTAFTAGRLMHAWHFIHERGASWQRGVGFTLSSVALCLVAICILGKAGWVFLT